MSEILHPDVVKDEQSTVTTIKHVALTRDRYVCGAPRDPDKRFRKRPDFDCVVCLSLWWGFDTETREYILSLHDGYRA